MALEEVEEKLSEIYSLAGSAQNKVRILMAGSIVGITLTSTQKGVLKTNIKKAMDDITKLVETGKKILEGLK